MSGAESPDTRAELAAVNEQLAGLHTTQDRRDEARLVALDLRARELQRRLDNELGAGRLGTRGKDGFYGSGY